MTKTFKQFGLTCILLGAAAITAQAGYDLPSKVYEIKDFQAALAKSQETGKPLAIIQSDEETACPLCENATKVMFDEMSSRAIIVHFNNNEKAKLPEKIREPFAGNNTAEILGKFIPRMGIFNPTSEEMIAAVTYESVKAEGGKAFREANKAIREYRAAATQAPASRLDALKSNQPKGEEAGESAGKLRTWTNSSGQSIKAELVSVSEGKVRLKLENGAENEIPLSLLSPADQKFAQDAATSLAAN